MKNAAVLFYNILFDMIHWYILHYYHADHRFPYAQQQNLCLTYHTEMIFIHMIHMIHLHDTDVLFYNILLEHYNLFVHLELVAFKVKYLFLNFK